MKRILLFSLLLLFNGLLMAQSDAYNREQRNQFLDADSYFVYGDFRTALNMFKLLEGIDPNFNELDYKIALSHYQLKEYDKSIPYFKKGSNFEEESYYFLAGLYLRAQLLDSASYYLEQYSRRWDENASQFSKEEVAFLAAKIKTAEKFIWNPESVNIKNLGAAINTENDEYVPLIDADEGQLIFTSKRETENNGLNPLGVPYEDVYVSYRQVDGKWGQASEIKGKINTKGNDACVGLSPNGDQLFIFRPNENLYAGDIYESKFDGEQWSNPVILDNHINNFQSIEASATVSLDGKTIYFSSNREGGYGGFDLYRVVKLPNGEWSWAKNLGPSINTDKNEDAPFLHPDGKTLFFSSQGHENMGGYDVFKTELMEAETWSTPENLGYPTNTTADDIHFVISTNEQRGYYSSEKEDGFGGQDIYEIDYLEKSLRQSVVRAYVKNSNGDAVAADISLIEIEKGDVVGNFLSNPKTGSFIFLVNPNVLYELVVETDEYEEEILEVEFTVEDLMQFQTIEITLKP